MANSLAFLLTWTTYGTWLPGDERGWMNRHRRHGEGAEPAAPRLEQYARSLLTEPALRLKPDERTLADTAIHNAAAEFGWTVRATQVRSNHVHVVVAAPGREPWQVMAALKVRMTQALVASQPCRTKWWSHEGGKHRLKTEEAVRRAITYVNGQDSHGRTPPFFGNDTVR